MYSLYWRILFPFKWDSWKIFMLFYFLICTFFFHFFSFLIFNQANTLTHPRTHLKCLELPISWLEGSVLPLNCSALSVPFSSRDENFDVFWFDHWFEKGTSLKEYSFCILFNLSVQNFYEVIVFGVNYIVLLWISLFEIHYYLNLPSFKIYSVYPL